MVAVRREILNFLTGIHGDDREREIFDEAFSKAYRDMASHTVAYVSSAFKAEYIDGSEGRCERNKMAIRDAIKTYITDDFKNLVVTAQAIGFENWHAALCDKIIHIGGNCPMELLNKKKQKCVIPIEKILCHQILKTEIFTYGQAQKLVNMMLKYLYIYCSCEGWPCLDGLVNSFHTPVDRFVLRASLGTWDYQGTPWSQIKDKSGYLQCQRDIKAAIDAKEEYKKYASQTAFQWELAEWPFGLT